MSRNPLEMDGAGDRFQAETSYHPDNLKGYSLDWSRLPETYKHYEAPLSIITLPAPELPDLPSLWTVLQNRRSRRSYNAAKTLSLNELSALLWATQGITAKQGEFALRTSPSAGALYPVETYLYARAVQGLKQGIYHFRPYSFDLEFLRDGDFSRPLAEALLGQSMVMKAQVTFIWSSVVERAKCNYRQRSYRYIYLDAGHIGQNLYLAAEALKLGVCAIGAFFDNLVNSIIGVDGIDETVIYISTAGWPLR